MPKPGRHRVVASVKHPVALRDGMQCSYVSQDGSVALGIYVEYVAKRMMAEVRNIRRETYTAFGTTSPASFGTASVHFETKPELLFAYLNLMREVFAEEAGRGKLTDEQIGEAIWLYRTTRFKRNESLLRRLGDVQAQLRFQRIFNSWESPSQVLARLKPQTMRASLRRHFVPENEFVRYSNPLAGIPMLTLAVLCFLLPFLWIRHGRQEDWDAELYQYHERVRLPGARWVLLAYLFVQCGVLITALADRLSARVPDSYFSLTTLPLWEGAVALAAIALWGLFLAKLRAAGLMEISIVQGELSLRGRYHDLGAYPLNGITAVAAKRAFHALTPRNFLFCLRHCYFWQKGLVLRVNGKRRLFVPTRHPEQLTMRLKELRPRIPRALSDESPDSQAA